MTNTTWSDIPNDFEHDEVDRVSIDNFSVDHLPESVRDKAVAVQALALNADENLQDDAVRQTVLLKLLEARELVIRAE